MPNRVPPIPPPPEETDAVAEAAEEVELEDREELELEEREVDELVDSEDDVVAGAELSTEEAAEEAGGEGLDSTDEVVEGRALDSGDEVLDSTDEVIEIDEVVEGRALDSGDEVLDSTGGDATEEVALSLMTDEATKVALVVDSPEAEAEAAELVSTGPTVDAELPDAADGGAVTVWYMVDLIVEVVRDREEDEVAGGAGAAVA